MEDLLTVRQVAILLKVHHLTVRRYINDGKLKAIRVGGNVRVSHQEVHNFSQSYVAHLRPAKAQSSNALVNPFSPGDSLFRLKGRGLSLDTFNN